MPIFFDEAIWIYWSKVIATSNAQWFYALTNGKMPLLSWLIVFWHKVLPEGSYMIAGRLPAAILGITTVIGVFKLGELIQGKKLGLLAALIYTLLPFSLFYDRMALFDGPLSAMLTWASYFCFKTIKETSFKNALLWGVFLGLAFHFKATAGIYLGLTILIFLGIKGRKYLVYALLPAAVSLLIANIIIFSSGYSDYWRVVFGFTATTKVGTVNRLDILLINLKQTFDWFMAYNGILLIISAIAGGIILFKKNPRYLVAFLILVFVPIMFLSLFGIYFARYILFTNIYIVILAALFISQIKNKTVAFLVSCIILASPVIFSMFIVTDPTKANFVGDEKRQYIESFSSGYGLDTIYEAIRKELDRENVTLVVQGSFSHFPWAFNVEFWGDSRIKIIERWPLLEIDHEIMEATKSSKVLFVISQRNQEKTGDVFRLFPFEIITTGIKPSGIDTIYLTTFPSENY